eukprot:1531499-Pleurochrysis_carterae.AAC.1
MAARTLRRPGASTIFPLFGIDPAGTGMQPYVSMRLCKKAPQDWWVLDDGSTAAGRFDQPGSSVSD